MSSDAEKFQELIRSAIADNVLQKAVFSKPVRREQGAFRVDVRPVRIQKTEQYQFTFRIGKQDHHKNLQADEAAVELEQLTGGRFRDCHIWTDKAEWTARYNRKGACSLKSTPVTRAVTQVQDHNQTRQYLIPEGQPVPFLIHCGVMTGDGRVRSKYYSKFRQINRFAEFVRDALPHLPDDGVIRVADFGCGKSYLTFATHYLLTQLLGRQVEMIGLDRRADVVETCRQITHELGLAGLQFEVGDIAGFRPENQIHLAISLHACDTATDDALAEAVRWQSDVIMAVPCCQHELAGVLSRDQQPVFSSHGILHERFSSLATDALRAALLECAGYRTQVLEFIDTEHTPKNLLIRAIRRRESSSESSQNIWNDRMLAFSSDLKLPPLRLQRKLEEYGIISASD